MRSTYTHPLPIKLIAIGAAVAVLVVGVLIYAFNSFARVEPGFVGLVRNGGPFDNRNVTGVITPADGITNVGFASTVSQYPTSERFDDVAPGVYGEDPGSGDSLGIDRYRTRTKDGQDVGVQGQWRYTLNTDRAVLEEFDQKYGTRTYAVPGTDERVRVSDGDQGMAVFIYNQLRQTQQEAIRQGIGGVTGAQLDPSLGLLTVTSTDPGALAKANAELAAAGDSTQTFINVSKAVSDVGAARINEQLGAAADKPYFLGVRFTLQAIAPSPDTAQKVQQVRNSVADLAKANADAAAQVAAANGAAQKAVAEAEGRRLTAEKDAAAQVARQAGYNACSTCAEIDRVNAQGEAQKLANSGWGTPPQVYAPGFQGGFLPQPR